MASRHVLITQSFLYQFGGSEVITLELSEHLLGLGDAVTVLTHGYDEDFVSGIRAHGARIVRFADRDELDLSGVDVLWVHHSLVPDLRGLRPDTPVVFNHMSSFHPLEFPLMPRVERAFASAVLFPSPEARDAQLASGLLEGIDPARLHVLGNPAPDSFLGAAGSPAVVPSRGLVVSNHLPPELVAAIDLLRSDLTVDIVGAQQEFGAKPARVTPELLAGYDFVVTIGKTVQFALAVGRPAFCYDHFGGPGWLSTENLERARYHNFSGRGFGQRSAEQLAAEIREGYAAAVDSLSPIRADLGEGLTLGAALGRVLSDPILSVPVRGQVEPVELAAAPGIASSIGVFAVMTHELAAANRWLTKVNHDLEEIGAVNAQAAAREARLQEVYRESRAHVAELERRLEALQASDTEVSRHNGE